MNVDYSFRIIEYVLTQKKYSSKKEVMAAAKTLAQFVTSDSKLPEDSKNAYFEAIKKLDSLSFEEMREIIVILLSYDEEDDDDFDDLPFDSVPENDDAQQKYEMGVEQYAKKNYKTAFKLFVESAEFGNAGAQYNAGVCLYHGRGAEKNKKRATEYWIKAAGQGLDEAKKALEKVRLLSDDI